MRRTMLGLKLALAMALMMAFAVAPAVAQEFDDCVLIDGTVFCEVDDFDAGFGDFFGFDDGFFGFEDGVALGFDQETDDTGDVGISLDVS